MAYNSGIEWCDDTWNPVRGCTRVSEGCRNCYAETVAARFSGIGQPYAGFAEHRRHGSKWTGKVELIESALDLPLRWRKPRRIFVNSMSDLFHESLPDAAIDRVFAAMALAPQHTFQILTKRAARMRRYFAGIPELPNESAARDAMIVPLPNVWLGVSVENKAAADERIPDLLATPAAKRFISAEPLLGPIDLRFLQPGDPPVEIDALNGTHGVYRPHSGASPHLDWVIAGGESGPNARPMDLAWMRSLRDQCKVAGVAFFGKQDNKKRPLPDDLMVREFPDAR